MRRYTVTITPPSECGKDAIIEIVDGSVITVDPNCYDGNTYIIETENTTEIRVKWKCGDFEGEDSYKLCTSNSDCSGCDICQDGICQNTCDKYCYNSECVDCLNSGDCPTGYICVGLRCILDPANKICPDGTIAEDCLGDCNSCQQYVNGRCVDIICDTTDTDCDPTKKPKAYCVNGDCVECTMSSHCGPNERCTNNKCDCLPGFIRDTITGQCVDGYDCMTSNDCPSCYDCYSGKCLPTLCPDGRVCVNGKCVTPCTWSGDCGGKPCINGFCDEDDDDGDGDDGGGCDNQPCTNFRDCGIGCGCNGRCVTCSEFSCANNVDCPNGCDCVNGKCASKEYDDPGDECENTFCNNSTDCGPNCGCNPDGICVKCDTLSCFDNECSNVDGCACDDNFACSPFECDDKLKISTSTCSIVGQYTGFSRCPCATIGVGNSIKITGSADKTIVITFELRKGDFSTYQQFLANPLLSQTLVVNDLPTSGALKVTMEVTRRRCDINGVILNNTPIVTSSNINLDFTGVDKKIANFGIVPEIGTITQQGQQYFIVTNIVLYREQLNKFNFQHGCRYSTYKVFLYSFANGRSLSQVQSMQLSAGDWATTMTSEVSTREPLLTFWSKSTINGQYQAVASNYGNTFNLLHPFAKQNQYYRLSADCGCAEPVEYSCVENGPPNRLVLCDTSEVLFDTINCGKTIRFIDDVRSDCPIVIAGKTKYRFYADDIPVGGEYTIQNNGIIVTENTLIPVNFDFNKLSFKVVGDECNKCTKEYIVPNPNLDFTVTTPNSITLDCVGAGDATWTFDILYGLPNYNYEIIRNGQAFLSGTLTSNTEAISIPQPWGGTYIVKLTSVTDGCFKQKTITWNPTVVNNTNIPSASVQCVNGSPSFTITSPFISVSTIEIDNVTNFAVSYVGVITGTDTFTLAGGSNGTYRIRITPPAGVNCPVYETFLDVNCCSINFDAIIPDPVIRDCPGQTDYPIQINITSGQLPIDYEVTTPLVIINGTTNSGSFAVPVPFGAGDITITLSKANDCSVTKTFSPPSAIQDGDFDSAGVVYFCEGGDIRVIINNPFGVTTSGTFTYDNQTDNFLIDNQTTLIVPYSGIGTAVVTVVSPLPTCNDVVTTLNINCCVVPEVTISYNCTDGLVLPTVAGITFPNNTNGERLNSGTRYILVQADECGAFRQITVPQCFACVDLGSGDECIVDINGTYSTNTCGGVCAPNDPCALLPALDSSLTKLFSDSPTNCDFIGIQLTSGTVPGNFSTSLEYLYDVANPTEADWVNATRLTETSAGEWLYDCTDLADEQEWTPLILSYRFDSANPTVSLYINDDALIDWGDNSTPIQYTGAQTINRQCTVPGNTEFTVTLSGAFTHFRVLSQNNNNNSFRSVVSWGNRAFTSMNQTFRDIKTAFTFPVNPPNLSQCNDVSYMFNNAVAFNQPIGNWDVSSVTNMTYMFRGAKVFNQPIGNWDVSSVTNMRFMFTSAFAFNQPIGNWERSTPGDTSTLANVTDMSFMFTNASSFNQPIGNWDVSSVADMSFMFNTAVAFNQPIGNWDVSSVNNMREMFREAKVFNQPIGNWERSTPGDTSTLANVTDMSFMFTNASSFNQPIGNWDVSSVNNMSYMFNNAVAFNQPIGNWDVSSVNNMREMFREAKVFNQPIGNWERSTPGDTSTLANVTDMEYMFANASSFNQPIGNWDVSSVNNMSYMFNNAVAFNQPIGNWDVSSVNNMREMFREAKVFNQPIGNWERSTPGDTSTLANVTDMEYMFANASSFNQPIGNWDVSSVNNMRVMFRGAFAFNQPIGNWDVSSVADMSFMFRLAYSFNQPIGNWERSTPGDTSTLANVTDMSFMFDGANVFNQPIGNWDVSSVNNMREMFREAFAFNQPIGNWERSTPGDTSTLVNVTDMRGMFYSANNFNQPIGNWDVSSVNNMREMFSSASLFNQNLVSWSVNGVTNCADFSLNTPQWTLPKPNFTNCTP